MNRSLFKTLIILSIFCIPLSLFALQDTNPTDLGWEYISKNKLDEANDSFLKAININPENARPYLALSYLEQLAGNNSKAWEWYETALDKLDDPNPYIFAAVLTPRAQLGEATDDNQGIYRVFPRAINNGDPGGVLRAETVEMFGRFYLERGEFDDALDYYNQIESIKDWTLIGPFENISASGYDKVFQPELEYNSNTEYSGKNDDPVQWFKVNKIRYDQWIDFNRYFADDQAIYYGNTFIYSETTQTAQIRVGTSGSVKVFLNNQLIIANEDENNNDLDTYIAETTLQAGWNRLLIKCGHSEIDQCNFLVRVTSEYGRALKGLKTDINKHEYKSITNAPVKLIPNFAEKYFENLIKAHPEQIENYLLLSECYLRNDKAPEAEKILLDASTKMPESVLIQSQLIETYLRGEKTDEMMSTVAKIYSVYPNIPSILQLKVQEYLSSENMEKTEEMAALYEKLLPGSAESMIMQITIAFKKGDMEKGFAILSDAYKKYPNNWQIVYLYALLNIRTKQSYDEAIDIYNEFLETNRTDQAYIQLANTYLNASNVDKFEDTYLQMLKENPASTGIYYALAKVFFQIQNYGKAEKYLDECLDLCPSCSAYWSLLGEVKQSSGKKNDAVKAYQTALKYNAKDYTSRSRVRELEDKKPIFNYFNSNNIDSLVNNSPAASSYPSDGAIYLLDDTKMAVYENGAYEKEMEVLIKVFNADGIDVMKEYSLAFNGYSERLIIDKAITRKADGTEIKADNNDNYIVFKSLEPNDFIYIHWHIQGFNQGRLSHHFWEELNFNYFYPVSNVSFSLLINKEIFFKHKTQNMPDTPTIKETDEGLLYTWSLTDQPAIKGEYNMPSLDDIGKMLFISSIPNWEYLVDWYKDLADTKTKPSYEVKDKVQELLKDYPNATDMKKIEVIYNYITENINYSSVSFRQSGLIPQSARKVLVQKIGDCKDVATLCIAMLKEAGISAHYVLVNTFNEGLNKGILPSIDFNHAIVGVETQGRTLYMDLTAKNYPVFSVPENDINAFALSISDNSVKPFYLDKKLFKAGITERNTIVKINDDNSVEISRNTLKKGLPGAGFRESYRFKGEKQMINELTESLADEFPNVKVTEFEIDNINDVEQNIDYHYTFKVPFYVTDAGNMKLLKLPWSDNATSRRSLSYENRNYDYQYRANSDTLTENIELQLPKGFTPLNLQKETHFGSKVADYYLSMEFKNGVLHAYRKFINKKGIVSPTEYNEFKEFYNQAIRTDAQQIILQTK